MFLHRHRPAVLLTRALHLQICHFATPWELCSRSLFTRLRSTKPIPCDCPLKKKNQPRSRLRLRRPPLWVHENSVLFLPVFSKTYCGYSKRVKQLLTQLGATYKIIELDETLAATNLDDQELSESMQRLLIVMQRLHQKIALMLKQIEMRALQQKGSEIKAI